MDIKQLLEKMDQFAGQAVGQKPGDQWRGTDKGTPGKKLVGGDEQQESILKDLKKGPTPKTREQELSEEFQEFLEAEFKDTNDKRPARKSDRHPRGHEPHPRYTTVKADESAMGDKDIELQDYRSMSHKEFQTAYGMTKTEWISKNKSLVITNPSIKKGLGLDEAGNPAQQAAIAIAMKKAGKKPKHVDEGSDTEYTVHMDSNGRERSTSGTIAELLDYFGYTLEVGKSYEHERGRYKINMNPTSIGQLIDALNKAQSNSAANGQANTHYSMNEGVAYKATNQHPASRDPIVAQVVKQMRPGLTGLDMGNEAFLYFAYELGKQRARDAWEDYLPAIRDEYEKGLTESYDQPNIEYKGFNYETEPLEDEDTRKILHYVVSPSGKRADIDWSPWEYMTQEDFELWLHVGMPSRKDTGSIGPLRHEDLVKLSQVNENSVTPLQNKTDLEAKRKAIQDLQTDPNTAKDPQMKQAVIDRKNVLDKQAKDKGFEESRGHTILANKLKDIERAKKFASGELKVPTPQERQTQLKQLEKEKKTSEDIVPMDNPQANPGSTNPANQPKQQDPKAAAAAVTALTAMKSATQSSAPAPMIAKAIDDATLGKPVGQQDMKALQPMMNVVKTASQDPKVAQQFKNLSQQAKQSQQQQAQKDKQQQQTT